MKGTVHYELKDNVAVLTVDNPPVNPLSEGVRNGLYEGMEKALTDDSVIGVVITGNGRAFIAGADISEFGGKPEGHSLNDVFNKIETSVKPVVAAMNGLALGGGLETALVCNYRIANPSAFVGLPEVNLGLLPGAGGTQRLPRLVGPAEAMKMMITGSHIPANKALKLGVVDDLSDDVVTSSIEFIQSVKNVQNHPQIRNIDKNIIEFRGNDDVFNEMKQFAAKIRKGQFAPGQIIKCVESAVNETDFDNGLKKEGELFLECLMHPQREAMIHIFFGERAAAKIDDVPRETQKQEIKKAAVIGSGTMGGGIAMCFANAGIPVHILDQDEDNLKRGIGVINKNYEMMVERGRLKPEAKEFVTGLITSSLNYDDIHDVDIVVEAVYENIDLKKKIFEQLDEVTKPETILATNTSGLDVDGIASVTKRPEKVVGTHFFSPANIMRLLEVVRGNESSNETLATIMDLGKKLKKASVVSLNAPGFIGNRMLFGYSNQANMLLLEGALPHEIDGALEAFGMNMGPFRMFDLVGLDLGWRARKLGKLKTPLQAKISDALCDQDRFGQKNGKGFYNYVEGSRAPHPAPENEELYIKVSEENNIERRQITEDEIVERSMLGLVNEGTRILSEGVAQGAADIDIVYINGYGFPIWRGGPMHYANSMGLDKIVHRLDYYFEKTQSDVFKASEFLRNLANNGQKLGNAPELGDREPKKSFNVVNAGDL